MHSLNELTLVDEARVLNFVNFAAVYKIWSLLY